MHPDLLPSDITGTQIYDQKTGEFIDRLGPVHAHFVLLDEINRSSAKTQSAMFEAMQGRQTTLGGTIHSLPRPFLVIATQNPIEQEGTYQLPGAQLDRFLLKAIVVYPTPSEEFETFARMDVGLLTSSPAAVSAASARASMAFLQAARGRALPDGRCWCGGTAWSASNLSFFWSIPDEACLL